MHPTARVSYPICNKCKNAAITAKNNLIFLKFKSRVIIIKNIPLPSNLNQGSIMQPGIKFYIENFKSKLEHKTDHKTFYLKSFLILYLTSHLYSEVKIWVNREDAECRMNMVSAASLALSRPGTHSCYIHSQITQFWVIKLRFL